MNNRGNPVFINSVELHNTRHQQSTISITDHIIPNGTISRRI
jgi:hypothetical protein